MIIKAFNASGMCRLKTNHLHYMYFRWIAQRGANGQCAKSSASAWTLLLSARLSTNWRWNPAHPARGCLWVIRTAPSFERASDSQRVALTIVNGGVKAAICFCRDQRWRARYFVCSASFMVSRTMIPSRGWFLLNANKHLRARSSWMQTE